MSVDWDLVNGYASDCETYTDVRDSGFSAAEMMPMHSAVRSYPEMERLEFGKYKGLTIREVKRRNPSYVEWAIANVPGTMLPPSLRSRKRHDS